MQDYRFYTSIPIFRVYYIGREFHDDTVKAVYNKSDDVYTLTINNVGSAVRVKPYWHVIIEEKDGFEPSVIVAEELPPSLTDLTAIVEDIMRGVPVSVKVNYGDY